MRKLFVKYIIILVLSALTPLYAQYQMHGSAISSGGGPSSGTSYSLGSTLGESLTGPSSNTANRLYTGFWYVLSQNAVSGIEEGENGLPKEYKLEQNYPNPFNPSTVIKYQLPFSGQVTIKIYNVLGKEVATIIDGEKEAGYHQIEFSGAKLASGIYIYRLETANYISVMKMILMK